MAIDSNKSSDDLRVLFDEMMSADVADALKLLDKDVSRIGRRGGPLRKATPDVRVASIARKQGRYVFTNNYDMVLAAIAEGARFIWFHDGLDNSLTKYDTAKLFFGRWETWREMLDRESVDCLRVSRARSTPITPDRALVQARRLDRRAKRRQQRFPTQGRLSFD